jgi:hypothetical protein
VADIPGATPDERHRRFQRLLYRFGHVIEFLRIILDEHRGPVPGWSSESRDRPR